MTYTVGLGTNYTYNGINADSEDEAIEKAEEWFEEREIDVLHVSNGDCLKSEDRIKKNDVNQLWNLIDIIIDTAPEHPTENEKMLLEKLVDLIQPMMNVITEEK